MESEILVYVEPGPEFEGEAGPGELVESFASRVRDLGQGLGEIANDLRAQLDATLEQDERDRWGLDEVQLSFSLDLQASAGVVLARGQATAGFQATLTWRQRSKG